MSNYEKIINQLNQIEPNIILTSLQKIDEKEFLQMVTDSYDIHHPWVSPPSNQLEFGDLLAKNATDNFITLLVKTTNNNIAGVFNLSQIFRGCFQNTILGCYVNKKYCHQGYMSIGLLHVVAHTFFNLDLHRIEANVQPDNHSSIRLFANFGFREEGYSKNYLKIDGKWRDHKKFAITVEDWAEIARKHNVTCD